MAVGECICTVSTSSTIETPMSLAERGVVVISDVDCWPSLGFQQNW